MNSGTRNSNLPKILVALAAFVGAGLIFYLQQGNDAQADMRVTEENLVCTSCGNEFTLNVKLGDSGSAQTCPKCGTAAGWPLKYCSACNHKFPPPLIGDPPRPAPMPNCPKCDSNKAVGAFIPEFFEAMKELEQ
jgi:predicted RNA-binding Zn-ribbon protein involved in translation (DUF1610 family)